MQPFLDVGAVPVNSCLLVRTREQALAFPRGDITLGFCADCGFICNLAFEPSLTEYSGRYEETQAYSGTFNRFHEALASELVSRLAVRGKTVVEVGCGKGEFLALLCRLGGNRGIGFDPSFDANREVFGAGMDVRVVREFYGEGSGRADGDLVCCKMTLEHVSEAERFARSLHSALRPGQESRLFIQVPESLRILRDCAFEDIYYEHCSYFTPGSLARLFRRSGFAIERLTVTYAGQYLTLEARLADAGAQEPLAGEEPVAEVAQLVDSFAARYKEHTAAWRTRIEEAARSGPVVLWGSGSKAVAFLHAIGASGDLVQHVVDINPHRHGYFMPGTGQRILAPADLTAVAPRTVIAMNPIYREEIAAELARHGVSATLLTL